MFTISENESETIGSVANTDTLRLSKLSESAESQHHSHSPQRQDLNSIGQTVWSPWWTEYLSKCEKFMEAARTGNYEEMARLINVDYAED